MFAKNILAVKIIYPNETPLQIPSKNTYLNTADGMNTNQAKAILNNLDSFGKTLDPIKLQENAKPKNNEIFNKIKSPAFLMWFVAVLFLILVIVVILRIFQKTKF